ncbi:AMP-binding protein [Streptomyces sp. KM273126]|uniref:AMP-binding protein n=1 Tax=Streptomyces sp. KM273126 TaxID=2545247 RepID=UPI0028683816|nr:AMP-binding protein [Streptomyces sp. KM273126]
MDSPGLYARMARLVEQRPRETALVRGRSDGSGHVISFAQLHEGCRRTAEAFHDAGLRRGHKAVTMTRDPYELLTLVYGLFAVGAVPVLVDPGLPRPQLRACLDEVAPEAFVGEPLAHLARRALGWARGHVRLPLVTGRAVPGLGRGLPVTVPDTDGPAWELEEPPPGDLAMIAFTSGSTGVPKGAEYHYSTLTGQLDALGPVLAPRPGDVLLAGFLPFVLLGPALGLTTLAPAVSHRAPASTPPERLLSPLLEHHASVVAASPAVLGLLAQHCVRRRLTLPSVDRVVSFGAPLRAGLADALHTVLRPDAEVLSVYGATECLPVSAISAPELRCAAGAGGRPVRAGTCLGHPLPAVQVRILDEDHSGVGEIAVAGPNVSPAYHARPEATAAAKVQDPEVLLHRTGDLGRLDEDGRLWFHGRKSQQVTGAGFALPTEGVETTTDSTPGVRRTALVGVGAPGHQQAVLCVELERDGGDPQDVLRELHLTLRRHPDGHHVGVVLVHPGFPTDIRHNSKINRERLAAWAAGRLKRVR